MKKMLIALLAFVTIVCSVPSFAQKAGKGSPAKRAAKMTHRMQEKLNLSTEQLNQLKPLNLEKAQKQEEWKTLVMAGDKKNGLETRRAYNQTYQTKLQGILTSAQFEQYKQMEQEKAEGFKEKRKGRAK